MTEARAAAGRGRRGTFIAFEGGDASGKTTQARLLARSTGALLTREPGGTVVGERVRDLVLDPATGPIDPRTEALLVAAARAQHVAEVVSPALAAGTDVVTDRYIASSLAYQGYGRGLDVAALRRLNHWATGGLWPDLTVLVDVPPALAQGRLGAERDRLEAEGDGFHHRVLAGYRVLAAAGPEPWVVIDGVGSVDEVAARVRAAVAGAIDR